MYVGLYGGLQFCNSCKLQEFGDKPSDSTRYLAIVEEDSEDEIKWIDGSTDSTYLTDTDKLALSQVGLNN